MSAGDIIGLDNINLDLEGGVDIGLGEIAKALTAGVKADVGLAAIANALTAGVKADVGLAAIANALTAGVKADVGLANVKAQIGADAKVDLGLSGIRSESKLDLGLDDIRIRELPPIRLAFSVNPIRVHLPLNYSVCLQLFGIALFKFSICGEGMVVAEDYTPRERERCC